MKLHTYIHNLSLMSALLACTVVTSCADDADLPLPLTPQQQLLLGRSVDFNVSMADPFQTRTTWIENGTFNEQDLMRIHRQYFLDDGTWGEESYRTYYYYTKYAQGTNVVLEKDWRVYPDRKGWNLLADPQHDHAANKTFVQNESDSITWDDGRTLRFRAWSRSNYANCLPNSESNKEYYYPDFCVSDWVNVSGPTLSIPLVMKHLGSRIAFSPLQGNQLYKVEICTEWEDYRWSDNSDVENNDTHETESGKSEAQAKAECNEVLAAYYRMCLPGGVAEDAKHQLILKALTQNGYATQSNFDHLEDQPDNIFYHYGQQSNAWIKDNVQHPVFGKVNGSCYLITVPYDMSNESTQGDIITLPACTRFRIYVRDVNNGDNFGTGGYEGKYHIFNLSDIVELGSDGNPVLDAGKPKPKYPNGLEMLPGYSYKFNVGYLYDKFSITSSDNFSWDQQDSQSGEMEIRTVHQSDYPTTGYTWWKDAIANAIPKDKEDYIPTFTIHNEHEFIEFLKLVNGTAALKTSGLYRLVDHYDEGPDGTKTPVYGWSRTNDQRRPDWVTREEAEAEGYLFYQHYYPVMGDTKAYSDEDYLRGPFSFYDGTFGLHFDVNLAADLNLADWLLNASIGASPETPFMGNFNGNNHEISNVYVQGEALFGNISSAMIRNLRIRSTHPTALVGTGTVTNTPVYITGISVQAPSTTNSIAQSLTGTSFVVGCIHQSNYVGDQSKALVGVADNLAMYGCMQAAAVTSSGALLGSYPAVAEGENQVQFFAPMLRVSQMIANEQYDARPTWGPFMCNYYDTELSPSANAVSNIADDYSPWEYIRGRHSHILKAKNDLFIDEEEMPLETFFADPVRVEEFYGLAPWKAMNYAIRKYNLDHPSQMCDAHYESNTTGYSHQYPVLVSKAPGAGDGTGLNYDKLNPLAQPN